MRMRRLICTFVVRIWLIQVFSWCGWCTCRCFKDTFPDFYTPPHKKWQGILLYPPTLSVHPSVHPSICLFVSALFPCSNFSTFWPIFFRLCIDIGIGEEWYGILSGLIPFWNNRVMALDVCQKCFALGFRALTLVPFYPFSSNFA